ncbi:MAG: glycosyltransferase family 4 protein [Anaerolineae bacterium]
MRVLFVLTKEYGEQRSRRETRALAEAGHSVAVLARHDRPPEGGSWVDGSVKVFSTPALPSTRMTHLITKPLFLNPVYIWSICRLRKALDIDVLHVQDLPLMPLALLLRRRCGMRVIYDHHENFPAQARTWRNCDVGLRISLALGLVDLAQKHCVLQADHNLVVCEEQAAELSSLGVAPSCMSVVGNTPDLGDKGLWFNQREWRLPLRQPLESGFQLLYVGRLGHNRGLDTAIRGLAVARRSVPRLRLTIVGDGPARKDLAALVSALGLQDAVFFPGWVAPNRFPEYVANSDVCIVPHRSDTHINTTYPNKLLEFMFCRRPLIVSDAKPLKRIAVEESQAGLCFASEDPESFADCVHRLYRDHDLARALAEAGRRAVQDRYNWATDRSVLVQVYHRLGRECHDK